MGINQQALDWRWTYTIRSIIDKTKWQAYYELKQCTKGRALARGAYYHCIVYSELSIEFDQKRWGKMTKTCYFHPVIKTVKLLEIFAADSQPKGKICLEIWPNYKVFGKQKLFEAIRYVYICKMASSREMNAMQLFSSKLPSSIATMSSVLRAQMHYREIGICISSKHHVLWKRIDTRHQ